MTVTEYRKEHPDCRYCRHSSASIFDTCFATNKRKSKRQAKKCPCYDAEEWRGDKN